MPQTIGNPLSWSIRTLRDTFRSIGSVFQRIGGVGPTSLGQAPEIRRLEPGDLEYALRRGFEDFTESRSDAVFLILLYPVIGLALVAVALRADLAYLVLPAVTGFALLGPLAAIGLYEMSKRREAGLEASWLNAVDVFRLSTIGSIFALGLILIAIFAIWISVATALHALTVGRYDYATWGEFLSLVFTTGAGWVMIIVGSAVGALFAVLVLGISVVSFPLLVDREATLAHAVLTSVRVALSNISVITTWGVIVAGMLFIGALPLLLGLVVVMPVLGHATWHLYRRAVVAEVATVAAAPEGDVRREQAAAGAGPAAGGPAEPTRNPAVT